jgi:hypothetical protein
VGSLRTLRHRTSPDITKEYVRLKNEWSRLIDQYRSRSLDELKTRPVYREIIGLGHRVVPLMLRDIESDRTFLLDVKDDHRVLYNYPWFDISKSQVNSL